MKAVKKKKNKKLSPPQILNDVRCAQDRWERGWFEEACGEEGCQPLQPQGVPSAPGGLCVEEVGAGQDPQNHSPARPQLLPLAKGMSVSEHVRGIHVFLWRITITGTRKSRVWKADTQFWVI